MEICMKVVYHLKNFGKYILGGAFLLYSAYRLFRWDQTKQSCLAILKSIDPCVHNMDYIQAFLNKVTNNIDFTIVVGIATIIGGAVLLLTTQRHTLAIFMIMLIHVITTLFSHNLWVTDYLQEESFDTLLRDIMLFGALLYALPYSEKVELPSSPVPEEPMEHEHEPIVNDFSDL